MWVKYTFLLKTENLIVLPSIVVSYLEFCGRWVVVVVVVTRVPPGVIALDVSTVRRGDEYGSGSDRRNCVGKNRTDLKLCKTNFISIIIKHDDILFFHILNKVWTKTFMCPTYQLLTWIEAQMDRHACHHFIAQSLKQY